MKSESNCFIQCKLLVPNYHKHRATKTKSHEFESLIFFKGPSTQRKLD